MNWRSYPSIIRVTRQPIDCLDEKATVDAPDSLHLAVQLPRNAKFRSARRANALERGRTHLAALTRFPLRCVTRSFVSATTHLRVRARSAQQTRSTPISEDSLQSSSPTTHTPILAVPPFALDSP